MITFLLGDVAVVVGASAREGTPMLTTFPPSELVRELRAAQAASGVEEQNEAVIEEQCPKCKHNRLSYRTAQLRSADEGQTIFYTCLKCKHRFAVNS
mmetsp:Transcript_1624/g.3455  ORF Transcript_1624/g.3455 Transcript_1624/m.3455 type:complete len:97 (-) Transcript_1624:604-894(-)